MSDIGLTADGFFTPTVNEVIDGMSVALRAVFGASLRLGNTTIFGQIVAILAEQLRLLWETSQSVYSSQDPDAAAGAALDAVSALTGTLRPGAQASLVVLTCAGVPATLIPTGSVASTASTHKKFGTTADVIIATLATWAGSTTYGVGARVTNASRAYECTSAGTSAGSGGPTSTATSIVDSGAIWQYIGEGVGAVDADAQSLELGPIAGTALDISVRETAIVGWSSVLNLADALPGRAIATDSELRLLREAELAGGGASTPDALRSVLLELTGGNVESVSVFYNVTDTTDVDGVPPHSVEALVQLPVGASNDQLVFDTLFENVAAGIRTHGTSVGASLDSEGTSHVMKFTRPEEKTIYVDITLIVDPLAYPSDGDAQVKQAIADYGLTQLGGMDAVAARIGARAFQVPGVLDIPRSGSLGGTLIKITASPTADTTIAISRRQIARYSTSRVTVHTSPGVP